MAPENNPGDTLTPAYRLLLLDIADRSLHHGIRHGHAAAVAPQQFAPPLQQLRASFVTLRKGKDLRGCIGTLEAYRPLVEDVAQNAWAAGFRDPRFPALQDRELPELDVQISVLSGLEPLQFDSEATLLRRLRPGIDGLVLQEGSRRGTFLPAVWKSLPEPATFLRQLKQKAGLPEDYWSPSLQISRYISETFSRSTLGS